MLDARILGQLLLMQSMLINLPDENSIFSFVARGLADLPGVAEARVGPDPDDLAPEGFTRFPLMLGSACKGRVMLRISAPESFAPYVDYLNNFCFMLAVILEERRQRLAIHRYQSELENRVTERTAQLQAQMAERIRAEDALRFSEERYRVLVEKAPDAIVLYDAGLDLLVDANPVAVKLFGGVHLPPVGEASSILPPEAMTPEWREAMAVLQDNAEAALAGEEPVIERTLRDVTGNDMTCEVRLGRLPWPDRLLIRASFLDITERKRVMELVLQNEKMTSLGGLAAGMAHEINNPLAGIVQGAQVVLSRLGQDTPATLEAAQAAGCGLDRIRDFLARRGIINMVDSMREAAMRASHTVSTMLEFSRKSGATRRPANPADVIDKALELSASDYNLKKKHDFRRIRIAREYDPSLPDIPCFPDQLQQVIMNLIANAAHAMDGQADARITLRTAREAEAVRIEVEDNGPGMEEAVRRKIFEPFFTTKAAGEGTGLGLSVSYFIIATNHGGTLEVDTAPGRGSRFLIRLPLDPADTHAAAEGAA